MAIAKDKLAKYAKTIGKKKGPKGPKPPEHDDEDDTDDEDENAGGGGESDDDGSDDADEGSDDEQDKADLKHEMGEVDVEGIAEKVASGRGDKRLMKLASRIHGEHEEKPQWADDQDVWDQAVEEVDPHWDDIENPEAVLVHVYKALGGTIAGQ